MRCGVWGANFRAQAWSTPVRTPQKDPSLGRKASVPPQMTAEVPETITSSGKKDAALILYYVGRVDTICRGRVTDGVRRRRRSQGEVVGVACRIGVRGSVDIRTRRFLPGKDKRVPSAGVGEVHEVTPRTKVVERVVARAIVTSGSLAGPSRIEADRQALYMEVAEQWVGLDSIAILVVPDRARHGIDRVYIDRVVRLPEGK